MKDKRIAFRVSTEEYNDLKLAAQVFSEFTDKKFSVNQICRLMALSEHHLLVKKIEHEAETKIAKLTKYKGFTDDELAEIQNLQRWSINQIRRIGYNINQIARKVNMHPEVYGELGGKDSLANDMYAIYKEQKELRKLVEGSFLKLWQ